MISVVLSGGSGTRLWPLSRKKLPKQFCPLFEDTLFSATVKRLSPLGEVMVCTGEDFRVLTEKTIKNSDLKVGQVFYEPFGRNTAPAVALICRYLELHGKADEVVGIFPADHWIDKPEVFQKAIECAVDCANDGQIVTLGITPDYPATGFGYIECSEETFKSTGELTAHPVHGFVEKPDLATAKKYMADGRYNWNSGMFVFRCQTMIDAFKQFMPETWQTMSGLKKDLSNLAEVYQAIEGQSLDYGIMEHAKNQVCIPCQIGWNDLGSWDDIQEFRERLNTKFNQATGHSHKAKNCFAFSIDKKIVTFLGVDDVQVVNTPDVLYVGKTGRSQEIKDLLGNVKKEHPQLADEHTFEDRPWGFYKSLHESYECKVKVIQVDPGQQLSYQSHNKRSETWVVVSGEGEVVLNDEVIAVKKGKVIEIPQGAKHRMRNTGARPLSFVEVQQGDYFGEDDIIRYQDDYNRT